MNNNEIKTQILKLYKNKNYQPVSVAVIYREHNKEIQYLIVQSAKSLSHWYFPQREIKINESLKENLSKEINEKLGINFGTDITNIHFAYFDNTIDERIENKESNEFRKGKTYFYNLINYSGNGKFKLNKDIEAVKWVNYENAILHFKIGQNEKYNSTIKALKIATHILKKESRKNINVK